MLTGLKDLRLRVESYADGLDEIVFGGWLQVERMDKRNWSVHVGEWMFNVHMGKKRTTINLLEWPDEWRVQRRGR